MNALSLCILGCGNIGSAIAKGLEKSDQFVVGNITLTRRKVQRLEKFKKNGFQIMDENSSAVKKSAIVIIAVGPSQLIPLLKEISSKLNKNHLIISIVSGVSIKEIQEQVGTESRLSGLCLIPLQIYANP